MRKIQSIKTEAKLSLVLVFGEDDFEVRSQSEPLIEDWARQFDVDPECIDGNVNSSKELSDVLTNVKLILETFPLFGNGKILWLRNCNFLSADGRLSQAASTAREVDGLLEVLKQLDWSKTKLLISSTKVDKRKQFYKWIQKMGRLVECPSLASQKQGMDLACDLIEEKVRQSGKRIERSVAEYLLQCVGLDRRRLISECEKAILHSGNANDLRREDVESTVSRSRQARAFAFADAVADRNLSEALARLDEEIWTMRGDRQKSEIGLLYGLIAKFRMMLIVKDLVARGHLREGTYYAVRNQLAALSQNEFPLDKRFNLKSQNPFVIFRALSQIKHYNQDELITSLGLLMSCNLRLVSVSDKPASMLRDCIISIILGIDKKLDTFDF